MRQAQADAFSLEFSEGISAFSRSPSKLCFYHDHLDTQVLKKKKKKPHYFLNDEPRDFLVLWF